MNEDLQLSTDLDHFNDQYGLGTGYQNRAYSQLTVSLDF